MFRVFSCIECIFLKSAFSTIQLQIPIDQQIKEKLAGISIKFDDLPLTSDHYRPFYHKYTQHQFITKGLMFKINFSTLLRAKFDFEQINFRSTIQDKQLVIKLPLIFPIHFNIVITKFDQSNPFLEYDHRPYLYLQRVTTSHINIPNTERSECCKKKSVLI